MIRFSIQIFFLVYISLLAACDDVERPKLKAGGLNGKAFIGIVNAGTVTAYDFSNCAQGAQLGQATTDKNGGFSFSIANNKTQTPVLLVLQDFQYTEEAGGAKLRSNQSKLFALNVVTSGETSYTPITYWTTLSYASIATSCNPATVINDIESGNKKTGDMLDLDIMHTTPVSITTAEPSPSDDQIRYGIANAAVSFFMQDIDNQYGDGTQQTYNSLTYIDTMLEDLLDDSVLDGVANLTDLKLGEEPVSAHTYRRKLADQMFYATISDRNQSGMRRTFILIMAKALNDSALNIFGDTAVLPYEDTAPVISDFSTYLSTGMFVRFTLEDLYGPPTQSSTSPSPLPVEASYEIISPTTYKYRLRIADTTYQTYPCFTVHAENAFGGVAELKRNVNPPYDPCE